MQKSPKKEDTENVGIMYREIVSYSQYPSQAGSSKSQQQRTINGKIYGVETDLNLFRPIKLEDVNRNVCIRKINANMSKP